MALTNCPSCREEVLVPAGASRSARVMCPLCQGEFQLAAVLDSLPPELVVVEDPEAVATPELDNTYAAYESPQAEPLGGDEGFNLGGFAAEQGSDLAAPAFQMDSAPATADAPRPAPVSSMAKRPRRKQKSVVLEMVKVVGGGVMGLSLAMMLLWWVFDKDPGGMAATVGSYAPFLVPAKYRGDQEQSSEGGSSAAAVANNTSGLDQSFVNQNSGGNSAINNPPNNPSNGNEGPSMDTGSESGGGVFLGQRDDGGSEPKKPNSNSFATNDNAFAPPNDNGFNGNSFKTDDPAGGIPGGDIAIPAPNIPAPSIPAPNIPAPNIPAPSIPAPSIPAPSIPAPSLDGSSDPTAISIPSPSIPVPGGDTPLPSPDIPLPSSKTPDFDLNSLNTDISPATTEPETTEPETTEPETTEPAATSSAKPVRFTRPTSVTMEQLTAATDSMYQAAIKWANPPLDATQADLDREFYMALAALSEKASFADSTDADASAGIADMSVKMKRFAGTAANRQLLAKEMDWWLENSDQRTNRGVAVAEEVVESTATKLVIKVPHGELGTVTFVAMNKDSAAYDKGDQVLVFGVLSDDPPNQIEGYEGNERRLLCVGHSVLIQAN